jgi:PKD repeat protein
MIKKYYSLLLWSVFICLIHSSLLSASVSKDDESLLGTMFVRDTTFSKYAAFCNNSGKPTIVFKGNSSISLPPIIDFTFTNNNVCSGQTISFTSTVTGISPLTYAWDFGDGSTSTLENPSHSFQAILGCGTQVFNVTLIVTDSNSDTETISKPITVKRKPDISFEDVNSQIGVPPFENCNQSSINYTVTVGNISNSSSCITSYSIDWGDGISASNVSFPLSHTYQSIGSFNMVINGLGSNGCQVQKVYLVKNSSNPSGGLPSPGGTVNLCTPMGPLQFTITQWGANPIDTFYNVDFGDGTTFTLTQNDLVSSTYYNSSDPINSPAYPIPHTYMLSNCPNSSSYTLLLDIITSCGETNLTQGPISILEKPEVSFIIPDTACINVNVTINNTSSTGYNPNCNTDVDWFWDMGDGTTYMDFEPVHSYSAPGIYTVSS